MDAKYKQYTDTELISMCLQGDSRAWEALILRYRRLIYSIPVRFSFGSADASDVFQSVCLKLIEHLHELKDETKLSAWLITTTPSNPSTAVRGPICMPTARTVT